jgi:hypothetical protein
MRHIVSQVILDISESTTIAKSRINWKLDVVSILVNWTQWVAIHPMGKTMDLMAPIVTTNFVLKHVPYFTWFLPL